MTLLVTGATGFIGRHVLRRLADDPRWSVVATSRTRPNDLPDGMTHVAADLLAPGAAEALMATVQPTTLLHLAWTAKPGKFWWAEDNVRWAATTMTLFAAFAAQGGRRAVFSGSCAEYDWTGAGLLSEAALPAPATLYGVAKDATRRMVCGAGAARGLPVAWGRVFWLYGTDEPRGRLVSDVAASLAAGETVAVSEGLQRRDFLHVDDVAGAFCAALSSDWQGVFNIGSGQGVAVRDVVAALAEAGGQSDLIRFGAKEAAAGEPPLLVADNRILRDEIGFSPAVHLDKGLRETAAWWRAGSSR
jgi:nucleoside-diphosphate-sugar epimerase